jgi:protein involved in polysaccharide export with SLBB domain
MLALVGTCLNALGCVAPQLQVGGLDAGTFSSGSGAAAEVGPSLETFPSQRTAERKHKELPASEVAELEEPPPPPPRGAAPRKLEAIVQAGAVQLSEPEPPPQLPRALGREADTPPASRVKPPATLETKPLTPVVAPSRLLAPTTEAAPSATTVKPAEKFAAAWEPTAPPPRVVESPEGVVEPALPVVDGPGCADCADAHGKCHPRYQDGKHPWAKGCFKCALPHLARDIPVREVPKEGALVNTPPYIIETPDILLIESARSLPDQPIEGEHLVRMDGTISLGVYGSVRVAGLTIEDARDVVQRHLARFIKDPQVNLDVYAYNSKFYYIITDGAGFGWQVTRVNFTGNETVLDAISLLGGLPSVSSKRLWVARPDPNDCQNSLILPVDWLAIIQCGEAATNYQLFPGDRLFVQSDRLIKFDGFLAKIITPAERMLGVALLTGVTISRYQNLGRFINVFNNQVIGP